MHALFLKKGGEKPGKSEILLAKSHDSLYTTTFPAWLSTRSRLTSNSDLRELGDTTKDYYQAANDTSARKCRWGQSAELRKEHPCNSPSGLSLCSTDVSLHDACVKLLWLCNAHQPS